MRPFDVIAERTLTLLEENSKKRHVYVRLGKPEESHDQTDYSCPIQIVGLEDDNVKQIFGVDAFQALQLALRYISFRLHHCRKDNLALYCWEEGDDMGFPDGFESRT
jgi:hypothetical protein